MGPVSTKGFYRKRKTPARDTPSRRGRGKRYTAWKDEYKTPGKDRGTDPVPDPTTGPDQRTIRPYPKATTWKH